MKLLKFATKILARSFLILLGVAILLVGLVAIIYDWQDQTNGSLVSGGEERKYLLYVPDSVDPTHPAPLVISIHGYAEWPALQKDISHWNTLADRHGFVVVYPSGTSFPKRWRLGAFSATSLETQEDVNFISDMIDHLQQEYNIDERRIYANGLSNGGGMAAFLGCHLSQRIAAVGSVSSAYLFEAEVCQFSRPVPLIAFHGTADPIVPYLGGPSDMFDIPFPVVPNWIETWARFNSCDPAPTALPSTGNVGGIQYRQCEQDADVVFYTLQGGGHTWPGGEPLPEWIVGENSQEIDATELMWQFFSQYSLP